MKNFLKLLLAFLLLLIPATAFATTTIPWSITNLTDSFIFPNLVNGNAKGILVSASSTFNGNLSVSTLTSGNCVQASTGGLLISASGACGSGTGSTFGTTSISATSPLIWNTSTANMSIQQANGSQSGFLSSTDFNTFNNKQAAGNYLTALTGDITASGPGSSVATLATVNSNIGTFNNVTVNAKGLVTAASNIAYDTFGYLFPGNATTSALTLGGLTLSNITGTTQCLHVNSAGVISGTATDCGSSGGSVTAVTASYPLSSSGGTAPNITTVATSSLNLTVGSFLSPNISQWTNNSNYITLGSLSATSPIFYNNTTGVISSQAASASQNGYLTSTDWSTFNGKQAAGNYLTALTGDVTASGPGSAAATLATVNSNVGTFTYPSVTVNGKGLITAISNGSAPTTYTGTAPIFVSGSTIGTSFSTSTFNAFTAENTFTNLFATNASSTNATTTNLSIVGAASNCNGTSALTTNSSGVVGCTAQAQGTVTSVSVATANGLAGLSSGGATPSLTLSTTITGLLKGNGTAISAASNGTDFTLLTANTCGAGQFFNSATAAGVLGCGTPAGTTYTGTYPIIVTGSVISTAFSSSTLTASSPLTGSFAQVGTGGSLGCQTASGSQAGCLSSTDWTTFNGKQASGNYLTSLTGDGTASGPGSAAFTLATVNSNIGTFNNLTVNAKGLVTAASNVAYDTFGYPFPANATTSSLTFGGVTVTGASTGCAQFTSGVLSSTGSACGSGGATFAYPFTPSSDGGINTSATSTPIEGNNPGLGLDVAVTSWYGVGGKLFAYASSTNFDTIVGLQAGGQNATTTHSSSGFISAFGAQAAESMTTGQDNDAFGQDTMGLLTTGNLNVAFGDGALAGDTTGSDNAAFGVNSGFAGTGVYNDDTFVGEASNQNSNSGILDTTALGFKSAYNNTGWDSTFLGELSGQNVTSGNNNIAIGYNALVPTPTASNQLNIGNIIFGAGLAATSSNASVIPTITGSLAFGISTPTLSNFFTIATTSAAALLIQDGFGTQDALFNTASTTGSIFTVAATTSPSITSPIKLFDVDQYGGITASSTGASPTVACSPSGGSLVANSNDQAGSITTGTLSTSCTLTFAHTKLTTPIVMITASVAPLLSAQSTSAFTVTIGATTGGTINYFIVQP